jgi:fermentation-respiration switch protein FrsA (DUF1100 family)
MKALLRIRILVAAALLAIVLPVGGVLVRLKLDEPNQVFRADDTRRWAGGFTTAPAVPVQEIGIALPGGGELRGFTLMPEAAAARGYWVLHLHGNGVSAFGEDSLDRVMKLREQGLAVLSFDYRGFGATAGEPSEPGMYEDAEAAWQWLLAQGVPPERILIWGHSLGSGPAVKLATEHSAAALVLFGAFTSIADRAAELYPRLPVRWLVGVRFESLQRMSQVKSPVIIAHSLTDATIPYAHAERLFAAAPEPKRLLRLTMPDGSSGHGNALYDRMDLLMPLLRELTGMPAG